MTPELSAPRDRTPAVPAAPLLSVDDLRVAFPTDDGLRTVVDGVSFSLARGRTLGMVGESGCGKSMTALALMGLTPQPGRIAGGRIRFDGLALESLEEDALRPIRGARIAMIFQDPTTALNPVYTVGQQIAEAYRLHHPATRAESQARAVAALGDVGIPDPALRAGAFPHQLSGGMRQRAMIAMALINAPDLLIADEPTTALDTTVQAQILDLIQALQDRYGMAILFISHNLAAVSEIADDIVVMYAGRIVEEAGAEALFATPLHPYTRGLIASLPAPERRGHPLETLPGQVRATDLARTGCRFLPRCSIGDEATCAATAPALASVGAGHRAACFKLEDTA